MYYWSDRHSKWISAASGSFHNVGNGTSTIVSDSVSIGRVRTGRFKVVVTRGRPDVAMQLEIGWRPDSLVFLAQGNAPFTLATGRAADADGNFLQDRLQGDRSIIRLATANGSIPVAQLGPRYALGGSANLQIAQSVDWRQLSLWLGLLLSVSFVGFMANRLIRDLKSPGQH